MSLDELIAHIQNDLSFVMEMKMSFDGMLVKSHLEALRGYQPGLVIEEKVTQVLELYKHDGHQCFLDSDRLRIAQLLKEIITGLKEVKI